MYLREANKQLFKKEKNLIGRTNLKIYTQKKKRVRMLVKCQLFAKNLDI